MKTGKQNYKPCLLQKHSAAASLRDKLAILQWIKKANYWTFITKQECCELLIALQIAHQLHTKYLRVNDHKIWFDSHPIAPTRLGLWEGAFVIQVSIAIGLIQPIAPIIDYSHPALLTFIQKQVDILPAP